MVGGWGDDDVVLLLDTTVAQAWRVGELRKAEEAARRLVADELLAAQLVELRVYDPLPYPGAAPQDPRMYEGTGIGALYGLPGSDKFLPELEDWQLVSRRTP